MGCTLTSLRCPPTMIVSYSFQSAIPNLISEKCGIPAAEGWIYPRLGGRVNFQPRRRWAGGRFQDNTLSGLGGPRDRTTRKIKGRLSLTPCRCRVRELPQARLAAACEGWRLASWKANRGRGSNRGDWYAILRSGKKREMIWLFPKEDRATRERARVALTII